MMLSPSKRGRFLAPKTTVWSPSGEGSSSRMSFCQGKEKEIVGEEASLEPKKAALLGNHEYQTEEQGEVEVWRQFREAGMLDKSVLERREKEELLRRISELEKELYDYQYHMGLLLIDKKEWSSKYEILRQELAEAVQYQKQLLAGRVVAVSEFEKKEKNIRNTIETQKQSIFSLQNALSEMHAKHAEAELKSGNKLAQVRHLEENIEEKHLEVKSKVYSLNASLAEASRKSSDINRRLEDLEAREDKFQKEYSSFLTKKGKFEEDLDHKREDLLAWEQELQVREKKLAKMQYCLDERETEINNKERMLKKKKEELEEAWKNLWIFDDSLKLKEQDICMKVQGLDSKEKAVVVKQERLEKKENDLLAREEELSKREKCMKVEISKFIENQNVILESKKKDLELDMKDNCNSINEQIQMKLDGVVSKEITVENKEKEIFEREQVLEREMEKLKDKEKENEKIVNSMKGSIVKQLEDLRRDKDKFKKQWVLLDKRQLSLEEAIEQFNLDKETFAEWKHIEEEKLWHEKLEMTDRVHKLLEDFRQNNKSFEDVIACLKSDKFELLKGENANVARYFDAKIPLNDQEQLKVTKNGISTDVNTPKSLKINVLASAKSVEASPRKPKSVSLEGHRSWLYRLLSFSSNKRAGQPTGTQNEKPARDVCLCMESLQHEATIRPEELLGVVNVSSDTQRFQTMVEDPIILEAKNSYRLNDTAEPSSGIAHSSTNVLKSQQDNDPIGSNKEAFSMLPEVDSAHQFFKQKQRWRSGSVFVKKSRSVNALLENDKASILQNSQEKDSGCSTSKAKVRSENVDQNPIETMQHCRRPAARNNELEEEDLDDHYRSLSSQECEKGDCIPSEIEVPGLKHYNFRRSTIVHAVAVAETLADRAKRRKIEHGLQPDEEEIVKDVSGDEETGHSMQSSDSDWLDSQ